jgi:heme exporter protein A
LRRIPPMSELALESRSITKIYGQFPALRGVDLAVPRGASVTLFGRNGAGKTTFLKIAATLARPSSGRLEIAGLQAASEPERVRRQIGFLSHNAYVYGDLTPTENLRFFSKLYAIPDVEERIRALIDRVGLRNRRNDKVRSFSRGLLQRVGIARVMLHDPAVLLLDEPYTGLDAQAVEILNRMLDEALAEGRTVILTTHDLELGLRAADRTHIMDRGRIVYSGDKGDAGIRGAYESYIQKGGRG